MARATRARYLAAMGAVIDERRAVAHLRAADPVLGAVIEAVGDPHMRPPAVSPFQSLARSIVFQQLSGKAASTILGRFVDALRDGAADAEWFPAPAAVLAADDETFRAAGVSRQKTASLRDLAAHFVDGELSLEHFDAWSDAEIIAHLTKVRGIGEWTAQMFLMFQLRRPDVLPTADVGLNRAIRRLYGFEAMPKPDEVRRTGEPWHPWATVACWYLWRSEDVVVPA